MNHARLIFEDTPAYVPVPSELQHRKTEIIFLALDNAEIQTSTDEQSVTLDSTIGFAKDKDLFLSDIFFASLQKIEIEIENPPALTDLIGKVQPCFKSSAEVDAFIRAERDAWDD